MLWIGHQDTPRKLTSYAEKNRIPDYLYDPDDGVSRKFRITYGAGAIFIDRTGMVRHRIPKAFSAVQLETGLKKILAAPSQQTGPPRKAP